MADGSGRRLDQQTGGLHYVVENGSWQELFGLDRFLGKDMKDLTKFDLEHV